MISAILYVSVIRLVGHALILDYRLIELSAIIDGSLLCLIIDSDESEACRLALAPLKVVKEAPMVVSLDRILGLTDKLELIVDEEGTEGIVVVTGTVLGDEHGCAVLLTELYREVDEPLMVYLPAEVIDVTALAYTVRDAGNSAA